MRILKAILIFYQKLIVPALVLSALLGFFTFGITGEFPGKTVGISYFVFALVFHFFIYEVRNRNEYYFYYNIGLSHLSLWVISCAISFIIGFIFLAL